MNSPSEKLKNQYPKYDPEYNRILYGNIIPAGYRNGQPSRWGFSDSELHDFQQEREKNFKKNYKTGNFSYDDQPIYHHEHKLKRLFFAREASFYEDENDYVKGQSLKKTYYVASVLRGFSQFILCIFHAFFFGVQASPWLFLKISKGIQLLSCFSDKLMKLGANQNIFVKGLAYLAAFIVRLPAGVPLLGTALMDLGSLFVVSVGRALRAATTKMMLHPKKALAALVVVGLLIGLSFLFPPLGAALGVGLLFLPKIIFASALKPLALGIAHLFASSIPAFYTSSSVTLGAKIGLSAGVSAVGVAVRKGVDYGWFGRPDKKPDEFVRTSEELNNDERSQNLYQYEVLY